MCSKHLIADREATCSAWSLRYSFSFSFFSSGVILTPLVFFALTFGFAFPAALHGMPVRMSERRRNTTSNDTTTRQKERERERQRKREREREREADRQTDRHIFLHEHRELLTL